MNSRRDLFPPIEPYRTGVIRLDGRHVMYWEQSGNPRGTPALFLHGGPGAGATAVHRRFFDPEHWRIVIFDQRGAGRSTPLGEIIDNSPAHLRGDIERLRAELGIEKWLVFGGSWGSTLALHYAETHPERLHRPRSARDLSVPARTRSTGFSTACVRVFPEAWRAFSEFLPEPERDDILACYYRRLLDPDPRIHMPAARAWSIYEGACSTLLPNPETVAAFGEDRLALGLARIEAHYFTRHLFAGESDLLPDREGSGICPELSCRAAMTWSARSAAPTACMRLARGEIRDRSRCRPFGDGTRYSRTTGARDGTNEARLSFRLYFREIVRHLG